LFNILASLFEQVISDRATAKRVGQRHGKPVVFEVNAAAMSKDGYVFYCSTNQVWLVDRVPPEYLK
jgi:putative RNA 2'-phosphotransferase